MLQLQGVLILLVLSFMIEKVVEVIKIAFPFLITIDEKYKQIKLFVLISLAVSTVVAYGANLDMFALMGIEFTIPHVGIICVAIIMGAGSNFVHDFILKMNEKNKEVIE